jgi:hypothetical protein
MPNKFRLLKLLFAFGLFFLLATQVFFDLGIEKVTAADYDVNCSGTAGAPTAVTEATYSSADNVTFVDAGGDGYCELDAALSANNVIIGSGVVLTHVLEDVDGVTITAAGDLTITGSIDVDAMGCAGGAATGGNGYGPNTGTGVCAITTSGYGDGVGNNANKYGGGGGHGGAGGISYDSVTSATYGLNTAPVLFGSGGGAAGTAGGIGGGKVRLDVTGTLTVNGSISANGSAGGYSPGGVAGGGGSGGSVYISTGILAGSGSIDADGGDGGNSTANTQDGSGGGGGRIAVYYDTSTFSDLTNITATKGLKGSGGTNSADGSNGTTFILDQTTDDLNVTSGLDFRSDGDYTRGNITFGDGVLLSCDTFATLNVVAASTMSFDDVTWTCNTIDTINVSATTLTTSGTNVWTFSKAGSAFDLDVDNDVTLNNLTYTGGAGGTDSAGTTFTIDDAVNVALVNSDMYGYVDWSGLASLNIDADSSINVDAMGCAGGAITGGNGYGPNTDTGVCAITTSGYGDGVTNNANKYGGGGGHGGAGGISYDSITSATYDSNTAPVLFGSGGGAAGTVGGIGGGKARLDVTGTFTLNGSISANGSAGGYSPGGVAGGGGSGGSVYVSAGTLAGSGSIDADGGDGGNSTANTQDGSGGGGGRVSIIYGANSSTFFASMTSANSTAKGLKGSGGTNSADGSDGTLYTLQIPILDSITITDNSGYTNDTTPVITLAASGSTATHVQFSCNGSVNWSSWVEYPDDDVLNDGDGPAWDMTTGATGCSTTEEIKTITARVKDASFVESNMPNDTTTYDPTSPGVSSVSSTKDNGTYGASIAIPVTIQFDENVNVGGTPQIELDFDGTDRTVDYTSGTGTDTLTFTYTTVNGDNKTDLDYTGTDALSLNGGTITDLADNSATLTLATPGEANSLGSNKEINVSTNQSPTAASVTPAMTTDGSGDVTITFIMDDPDDDDTLQAKIEYSDDGGSTWYDPTLSTKGDETSATYGDPGLSNIQTYQVGKTGAYITSSSGANTVSIVWEADSDVAGTDIANAQIKVTPYDGTAAGTASTSSNFLLDLVDPSGLTSLVNSDANTSSITLTWTAVTETNFDHYEIWYGPDQSNVQTRKNDATEWDDSDDTDLSTKTTTSTTITTDPRNKYFKIWAVDGPGNVETVADIFVTLSASGGSSSDIGLPTNLSVTDNPDGGVILTWEDPNDESDYINIHRGISPYPVSGTIYSSVTIGTETYIDTDLSPGDTVTYMLRGTDGSTYGSLTDEVTFTLASTDTGGSSGGGGGGGSSSSDDEDTEDDEDPEEEEDEDTDEDYEDCITEDDDGESLEDLGLDIPDHWSEGYLKNLSEDDRIVAAAVETVSFMELLAEIYETPNEEMNRGKALEFLLVLGEYNITKSIVNTFTDVTADHVRGYMIEFAAEHGLINGYPDGTFQPENTVNRVEALKMSAYFFGLEAPELYGDDLLDFYYLETNPFTDVDVTAWYAPYLIFAYSNGVVSGYGDGTFGPGNEVTYAEFMKIATLISEVDNAVELASCFE